MYSITLAEQCFLRYHNTSTKVAIQYWLCVMDTKIITNSFAQAVRYTFLGGKTVCLPDIGNLS